MKPLVARAIVIPAVLAAAPALGRAQLAVVGNSVLEQAARPGTQYSTTILVQNTSDEPQEAQVYQTDYRFLADGHSFFDPPGTLPRSNAKWVTFSPARVVVPARTTVPVAFTVSVPAAGDSLAGTYWSMLMIEPVPRGSPQSSLPALPANEVRVGLTTVMRFGMQIATHVRGGTSRIEFANLAAATDKTGRRGLAFDLVNAGERAHRLKVTLEIYNERGELVGRLSAVRGLLYPGTSTRQTFDLGTLPPGTYKALAVADAGADELFGGQFTLRF